MTSYQFATLSGKTSQTAVDSTKKTRHQKQQYLGGAGSCQPKIYDGGPGIVVESKKNKENTLISLINVTSRLPILENSTLHKTKIPPARLLI